VQAREFAVEQARLRNEQEYQNALRTYGEEEAERQKMSGLRRILEGGIRRIPRP
jgi:hypothetical protein